MLILTASTSNQSPLVEIQRQSAILCGFQANEHCHITIPHDYPRHASWFRLQAILDHLPHHDLVLWMDSDAMLLRSIYQDKGFLFPEGHSVYISRDWNGFNHGVVCYRSCPEAREFIWRMLNSYESFKNHPWHEQAPFQCYAESYKVRVLPKPLFNAQPEDLIEESYILHLPNRSQQERERIMGEHLTRLKKL